MKTIEVGELKIELNVNDILTIGDVRKLYPLISGQEKGNELELIFSFLKAFCNDDLVENKINDLPAFEIEELTKKTLDVLTPLMEQINKKDKKDKKK